MNQEKMLTIREEPTSITQYALNEQDVIQQVQVIQRIMKSVMKEGEHYGVIPGCGTKPSLLKPGAEKLSFTFRLAPSFEIEIINLPNNHREYRVTTTLTSIVTGNFVGQGVGSCSTMESKYRFRTGEVTETGKPVPKEYWTERDINLIGGKGYAAKKIDGKWMIVQQGEKVENDNPADQYNTCLKQAKKRSLTDATLTATAASDIFTQDIEDFPPISEPNTDSDVMDEPDESQLTGDDLARRDIVKWCEKMEIDLMKTLLSVTKFTNKAGEEVSGVAEINKLSGKRLEIAHHKIHEMFNKQQEKPSEEDNIRSNMVAMCTEMAGGDSKAGGKRFQTLTGAKQPTDLYGQELGKMYEHIIHEYNQWQSRDDQLKL